MTPATNARFQLRLTPNISYNSFHSFTAIKLMNSKSAPIRFILLLITSFLFVVLLGFSPAYSQDGVSENSSGMAIAPNLSAFNLSSNLEPFIPPGLEQSNNPSEGSRGIIGRDDRLPVTSRSYPWSAIGQLQFVNGDSSGYCTGVLISADVVLTNAHCVINPGTSQGYQQLVFLPNLINGRLRDETDATPVEAAWAATDFQQDDGPPNPDDWALLKLSQPLGDRYGTIGLAPLPLSTLTHSDYQENLMMVGYSGDFPARNPGLTAGFHAGCSILGVTEGSLIHNCDTTGGSSGGPILGIVDEEIWIVALNSAEITDAESGAGIENYAVDLTRIVEQIAAASAE